MLDLVKEMVLPHPKSVLLFAVGLIDFLWVLNLLVKRRYKTPLSRAYLLFSFCIMVWVMGNAYAESGLVTRFGAKGVIYIFSFVGSFTTFSLTAFYYLSCLLRYGDKGMPRHIRGIVLFLIAQNVFFFAAPNVAVRRAEVLPDGTFVLLQGEYFFVFYMIIITTIVLGARNIVAALIESKQAAKAIENRRLIFVGLGSLIMYGNSIVFHMIYPYLTSDYSYSFIPPLFSLLDIVIVGYGVYRQRFVSLRSYAAKVFKHAAALGIAGLLPYLIYLGLAEALSTAAVLGVALLTVPIYLSITRFFESSIFFKIFDPNNTEFFVRTLREFRTKSTVYEWLDDLQSHVETTFCGALGISEARIVVLEEKEREYPQLLEHCRLHHKILVLQEVVFSAKERGKGYLADLKQLGEIILPLYSTSRQLLGFLVLGSKPFCEIYSREEIEAVEGIQHYLGLELAGILYQSRLQRDVERKTQDLRNIIKQQNDFLAISAHELRTPTAGILFTLADLLESDELPQTAKESISMSYRSSQKLAQLVSTLFEVQSYDLGNVTLDFAKIDVHEFMGDLQREAQPAMQAKHIDFAVETNHLPGGATLIGDDVRLRQVFRNLLANASKFIPIGARVVFSAEEQGARVFFKVADNGPGLPGDSKTYIFEKFRGNHSFGATGLGLGLYIAKRITALHGGKIWADDTPGGGATFYVELPRSGPSRRGRTPSTASTRDIPLVAAGTEHH